jgi:hypothetical protein
MQIVPHNKYDWLRLLVLPFKAYVVIAPLLFLISAQFPRPRHGGPTDAEALLVVCLIPCSLILLLAALLFALIGPKDFALPCAFFGALAFLLAFLFLPMLATA